MPKKIFVANWKMQLSFHEALDLIKDNIERLDQLSRRPSCELVICPTFTELYSAALLSADTRLHIGAQNVSGHTKGAYTGQICATSLAEIGCTFCIVGHSEARSYLHETNEDVATKCNELFAQSIIPIICIGETEQAFERNETLAYLHEQLAPVFTSIDTSDAAQEYVIAYEPIWSIASGNIPSVEHLASVFAHLHTWCKQYPQQFRLLYGGSVKPDNAASILKVPYVNGLLIGGASLDINNLDAIMKCM